MEKESGSIELSRFNAGSMIIENILRGYFFLFLVPAGGSNLAGAFPTMRGKANLHLT